MLGTYLTQFFNFNIFYKLFYKFLLHSYFTFNVFFFMIPIELKIHLICKQIYTYLQRFSLVETDLTFYMYAQANHLFYF